MHVSLMSQSSRADEGMQQPATRYHKLHVALVVELQSCWSCTKGEIGPERSLLAGLLLQGHSGCN
jgi:hypothetical protein